MMLWEAGVHLQQRKKLGDGQAKLFRIHLLMLLLQKLAGGVVLGTKLLIPQKMLGLAGEQLQKKKKMLGVGQVKQLGTRLQQHLIKKLAVGIMQVMMVVLVGEVVALLVMPVTSAGRVDTWLGSVLRVAAEEVVLVTSVGRWVTWLGNVPRVAAEEEMLATSVGRRVTWQENVVRGVGVLVINVGRLVTYLGNVARVVLVAVEVIVSSVVRVVTGLGIVLRVAVEVVEVIVQVHGLPKTCRHRHSQRPILLTLRKM